MHDEELRAIGVRAGVGHGDGAGFVAPFVNFGSRIDFVVETAAPGRLPTATCALGVAALNHEAFDYAMKNYSVVKAFFGEQTKIFGCFGRV